MLIKVSKILTEDQIGAVEIMLFDVNSTLKDTARVLSKATGHKCQDVQNEIASLFYEQIEKNREASKQRRIENLAKDSERDKTRRRLNKELKTILRLRSEKEELQKQLKEETNAKVSKLAEEERIIEAREFAKEANKTHRNKLLTMKW